MNPIAIFDRAVRDHLGPVAREFHLKLERIDERSFAMSDRCIAAKIYFPECHGFDVTVCLSPTLQREWNGDRERGLRWYLRFLGEDASLPERIGAIESEIDNLIRGYASPLRLVLHRFVNAPPEVWTNFYAFFSRESAGMIAKSSLNLRMIDVVKKKAAQPGATDNPDDAQRI